MSHTAAGWVLTVLLVASALVTIGQVGKPRKPLESGTAVVSTIVSAFLVYCVWVLWKG